MPEQFEVKRMANYLKKGALLGKTIHTVSFHNNGVRILKNTQENEFSNTLTGQTVTDIYTHAKYTIWTLDTHKIVWHYRFTGVPHLDGHSYDKRLYSIFSLPLTTQKSEHIRLKITFQDAPTLSYIDTRCLSTLTLYEKNTPIESIPELSRLAADLDHFTPLSYIEFQTSIQTRKIDLKTYLQNQFISPSGIGNYLACEILAAARLNPWLGVKQLKKKTPSKHNKPKHPLLPPLSARHFYMTPKNLLKKDGEAYYLHPFLSAEDSTKYFNHFHDTIPWGTDDIIMFGKQIQTKRKVAWYAAAGVTYTYAKRKKIPLPWTPELLNIKTQLETHTGEKFNACLLNLYHNGTEGMGWHTDNEAELVSNGSIASISLGAERAFQFKHRQDDIKHEIQLHSGSLLLMKGQTQKHWLHQLPKRMGIKTARINLTFRQMKL